jgi:hypothetical protein
MGDCVLTMNWRQGFAPTKPKSDASATASCRVNGSCCGSGPPCPGLCGERPRRIQGFAEATSSAGQAFSRRRWRGLGRVGLLGAGRRGPGPQGLRQGGRQRVGRLAGAGLDAPGRQAYRRPRPAALAGIGEDRRCGRSGYWRPSPWCSPSRSDGWDGRKLLKFAYIPRETFRRRATNVGQNRSVRQYRLHRR